MRSQLFSLWGLLLLLSSAVPLTPASPTAHDRPLRHEGRELQISPALQDSYWYDWGWYGAFPHVKYESFGAESPRPNIVSHSDRCDEGYVFVEPRGAFVETPGPVILDNRGNLVWMETRFGQAMDLKVQEYKGNKYLTFWHGTDNGTFGEGYYLMLDEAYNVYKKIAPAGDLAGDLHEFRITDRGTALMTIYQKTVTDFSGVGSETGWIYDSLFQEMDIESGDLIFEWHASNHFGVHESLVPFEGQGQTSDTAFDFFHINSVDQDYDGNYLVSSRYLCAVVCIERGTGRVLWQLGGKDNQFRDLSGGSATDMTWNHHASWYKKDSHILTVFDNGSNGNQKTGHFSRGLMISLDLNAKTAELLHSYIAPQKLLAPSQGSVQVLPNDHVLVGWGHTPAYTEYSMGGKVLCDVHLGPIWLANFGWVKNYRTFKFGWTGRPTMPPNIAVRPKQRAIFASWNGATEVMAWIVQSGSDPDGDDFTDHGPPVERTTFETKLRLPRHVRDFVRIVALDKHGSELGVSDAVSVHEDTMTEPLEAPLHGKRPSRFVIFVLSLLVAITGCGMAFAFRTTMKRVAQRALRKGMASSYQYEALRTKEY